MNLKTVVIRIVKKSCNQTHRGNHQTHRGADNRSFKKNRVCCARVKVLRGEAEGKRASVGTLHRVGKTEFHEDDRPHRHHTTEHINSADFTHGRKNARCSRNRAERVAVYDIDAVKNIGMDSNYHGDKGKDHSLKLISWHKKSSKVEFLMSRNQIYMKTAKSDSKTCVVCSRLLHLIRKSKKNQVQPKRYKKVRSFTKTFVVLQLLQQDSRRL